MFQNWGDVAMQIHDLVTSYARLNKDNRQIESFGMLVLRNFYKILSFSGSFHCWYFTLSDQMKDFVENYPQFRQLQTNACKHMTLAGELHRQIETRSLLEVSELEQELACTDDHAAAAEKLVLVIFELLAILLILSVYVIFLDLDVPVEVC